MNFRTKGEERENARRKFANLNSNSKFDYDAPIQ